MAQDTYTRAQDASDFQQAHIACVRSLAFTELSIEGLLSTLTTEDINAVHNMLTHSKENNKVKCENLFAYTQEGKVMLPVSLKIERAMLHFKDGYMLHQMVVSICWAFASE